MKRLAFLPLAVGAAAFVYACSSSPPRTTFEVDSSLPVEADGGEGGTTPEGGSFEFDGNLPDVVANSDECRKMDIVFVVDDSGSMSGAQAKLRNNFPKMVTKLNGYKTKLGNDLDYRLAVTSTDTARADLAGGGRGGFVSSPKTSCAPGGVSTRSWLERTDGDVPTFFGCRANLGTSGSATEKPIDSLVLSVTDRLNDQNKNFVRDDALLAFFILTDEEDSSGQTGDDAIRKFDALKKDRGRWVGALISGPKGGSTCTSPGDGHTAVIAPKLHRLVDGTLDFATGKSTVIYRTICQENYDSAITDALDAFTLACDNFPPLPK